jgi:cell division protein FtsB
VARPNLTSRAALLVLVLCGLLVTVALPLRSYLEQRQHIGELRERVSAQRERVADLEAIRARWQDPAYVQAQARERLYFVFPGETQYVVLEPEKSPLAGVVMGATPAEAAAALESPWFSRLWSSVEGAAVESSSGR